MTTEKRGHGNRKHLQILLSPNRGELFIKHMKEELDEKPTAWIREMIYTYLKKNIPKEIYNEAEQKDNDEWQQTVQNRLEGRALSKLLKTIR
jgi:hypothetical protein